MFLYSVRKMINRYDLTIPSVVTSDVGNSMSPKLTSNCLHQTESHFISEVVKSPGRVRMISVLPSWDNKISDDELPG